MRFFQQTDSSSQTYKKSVLGLIAMFICAFLAVGCSSGGGGDSFVASPGGGVPAGGAATGTGSVTFNFVKAQAPIVVPTSTVQLRFEFFTGLQGTGSIAKREVRDFANTVTIEGVPNNVRSTVVTAITADGFPISEFTANVTVPANGNVIVDAASGTVVPVTVTEVVSSPQSIALGNSDTFQLTIEVVFSNGDRVPVDLSSGLVSFVSDTPAVVQVNPTSGQLTAGNSGQAVVTGTFTAPGFAQAQVFIPIAVGDGVQPPPLITGIEFVVPATPTISLPRGSMSAPIQVVATYTDNTTATVTAVQGLTFEVQPTNSDVTVNGNQEIAVSSSASVGDTATVIARFQNRTASVIVNVTAEELLSISAAPATISLPYGGFLQTVSVTGQWTDGVPRPVNYADLDFSPNAFTRFTLNEATGQITTNTNSAPGQGIETVTATTGGSLPPGLTATFNVEVGRVFVTALTASPKPLELVPGDVAPLTLTATLSEGGPVNVSTFATLQTAAIQSDNVPPAPNNIEVSGNQVVAIKPTGTNAAQATFTLVGSGSGGGNVTEIVNVTVVDDVLVLDDQGLPTLRYEFGGIDIATFDPNGNGNAVNLPRGYVGVVEVYGTFTSGERQLRADEYTLILGDSPDPTSGEGAEAIKLYQTPVIDADHPAEDFYVHPGTNTLFTDGPTNAGAINQQINDLYYQPRTVADLEASGQNGSTISGTVDGGGASGVAVTRPTYRAVVADWRRGGQEFGFYSGVGDAFVADVTTPNLAAVSPALADQPFDSPNSSREVLVRLDNKVLPAGATASDFDFDFTVTVIDPREVTIDSAGFKNNIGDTRVPLGTVRELEVRVTFSEIDFNDGNTDSADYPLFGPTVSAITGFKLAEANVIITSSLGSPVARSAPTSLGFVGVFSNQAVPSNIFAVRAIPVGGDNIRTVGLDDSDDDTTTDTYEDVTNVYGAYSGGFGDTEFDAFVSTRDQILDDAGGAAPEGISEPDDQKIRIVTQQDQVQINFLDFVFFSINRPTATTPGVTNDLAVGASRAFRTLIQYQVNGPVLDISEDYPPTLFVDTTTPAAVSRADNVSPNAFPGNVLVSGINAMGGLVDETDIDEQTGDTVLGDELTAEFGSPNYLVEALVVSLDAAGFPIPFRGSYTAVRPDDDGNASPASSVSGLDVVTP